MDRNSLKSTAKEMGGVIKENVGKFLGDPRLRARGTAEKYGSRRRHVVKTLDDAFHENLKDLYFTER